MRINTDSPVLAAVSNVYHNSLRSSRPVPWSKLNPALRRQLEASIEDQFKFERNDFLRISKEYGFVYWGGIFGNQLGEGFYSLAAIVENISACMSFENWKERSPFFLDHQRIYVGREFQWEGELVRCTSFSENQQNIVACSYKGESRQDHSQIKSRYKITKKDLRSSSKVL